MRSLKPLFKVRIIAASGLDQHSPSNLDVTEVNSEYRQESIADRVYNIDCRTLW